MKKLEFLRKVEQLEWRMKNDVVRHKNFLSKVEMQNHGIQEVKIPTIDIYNTIKNSFRGRGNILVEIRLNESQDPKIENIEFSLKAAKSRRWKEE